jgi:hypothetical protein
MCALTGEHLVCVCVCVLSRWVHAALLCEGPDLPALKYSSHWSFGLYLASGNHLSFCFAVQHIFRRTFFDSWATVSCSKPATASKHVLNQVTHLNNNSCNSCNKTNLRRMLSAIRPYQVNYPVGWHTIGLHNEWQHRLVLTNTTHSPTHTHACRYTMAWWDWDRWELELDFMALQGVNLPLLFTGQECVDSSTLRLLVHSESRGCQRAFLACAGDFVALLMMSTRALVTQLFTRALVTCALRFTRTLVTSTFACNINTHIYTCNQPHESITTQACARASFQQVWTVGSRPCALLLRPSVSPVATHGQRGGLGRSTQSNSAAQGSPAPTSNLGASGGPWHDTSAAVLWRQRSNGLWQGPPNCQSHTVRAPTHLRLSFRL